MIVTVRTQPPWQPEPGMKTLTIPLEEMSNFPRFTGDRKDPINAVIHWLGAHGTSPDFLYYLDLVVVIHPNNLIWRVKDRRRGSSVDWEPI